MLMLLEKRLLAGGMSVKQNYKKMNRLINFIGAIVLCGIIIKLSFVFVFLFDKLDEGHIVGKITGVTFAFASVWFVIKIPNRALKITMVMLDVLIVLYYYLHELWEMPIEYSAIIVAAYSGLIVYYIGSIINQQMKTAAESDTNRIREELNRLRTDNECRRLEAEIQKARRRLADCKTDNKRAVHEQKIEELETKLEELKNYSEE